MGERDEISAEQLAHPVRQVTMSGKDKACETNQQTINVDVDSSCRGAAGRQRGSSRVDVNKMSSAIQPPVLKATVKTSYFRSGNWTLPQNYIYQQRLTHSHSAGAWALSLNHYFNCSECVSVPQIVALVEQTCQALRVCRKKKKYSRQTISGPLCKRSSTVGGYSKLI